MPILDLADIDLYQGGPRSILIKDALEDLRKIGAILDHGQKPITDLTWTRTSPFAIRRPHAGQVWHAGHVSAILSIGEIVIVGTQTGGLYAIDPSYGAIPADASHQVAFLSQTSLNLAVTCLARGPDPAPAVYVGYGGGGALSLLELEPVFGGLEIGPITAIPIPWQVGDLFGIAVLPGARRIVLSGSGGAWWSPIPANPSTAAGYVWQMGAGLPAGIGLSGIAIGPSETVAVGLWGVPETPPFITIDPEIKHGIYRGTWSGGATPSLTFASATMTNIPRLAMLRTAIASSEANRNVMYAVSAGADEAIAALIRSDDGGASWIRLNAPTWQATGFQGSYNNCIAVSPYRSSLVAMGWRNDQPYFSTDSGATWSLAAGSPNDGGIHSDLHALYFPKESAQIEGRIYVGCDGGLWLYDDLGVTTNSEFNKHLQNLQFYNEFSGGRFDASSRFPGLIAGGTQDNGNFYGDLTDGWKYWRTLESGDGGNCRFVDAIGALLRTNNTLTDGNGREFGAKIRISLWDPNTRKWSAGATGYGDEVPVDGAGDGLQTTFFVAVKQPTWPKNSELMYAVAAKGNDVYGLFAKSDGSGARLTKLTTLATMVHGLASYDGSTIYAGTLPTGIVRIDSASGLQTNESLPAAVIDPAVNVFRIQVTSDRAFALTSSTRLLRRDEGTWTEVGAGFVTFAMHPNGGLTRIFAAIGSSAFQSNDDGVTWQTANTGLPAYAACQDMAIAVDEPEEEESGHTLFLATYGHSVWKTTIDWLDKNEPPHVPELAGEILFGVIHDGGGLVRVGNKIVKVPPHSPVLGILAGIAQWREAVLAPSGELVTVKIEALRQIERAAAQEIEQLRAGRG